MLERFLLSLIKKKIRYINVAESYWGDTWSPCLTCPDGPDYSNRRFSKMRTDAHVPIIFLKDLF